MSALKNALTHAIGYDSPRASSESSEDDRETFGSATKYRLLVTAGPSYDASTHRTVLVNSNEATSFENDFMRANVKVRVKDYTGLPQGSPTTSPYFSDPAHVHDEYSISFSFIPKVDIPSLDTVWGNDFDHSIADRLPPGINTAFRIVKQFVDPGLEMDAYAEHPWLLGPSLSCWYAFRVGDEGKSKEPQIDDVVREGADGNGEDVRNQKALPEDAEKRRKYFLDAKHREDFAFEHGRQYQGDFHNSYINFNKMSLKLPGFNLQVAKYIGEKTHSLRYVFKNKKTNEVYFVVLFTLLHGQELQDATAEAKTSGSNQKQNEEDFGGVD